MRLTTCLAAAWVVVAAPVVPAADPPAIPVGVRAPKAFLDAHCLGCHDAANKAGGFDLEKLLAQPAAPSAFDAWVKTHDRVAAGEMPPPKKPRPPKPELDAVLRDLNADLVAADKTRSPGGRAVTRRLNRTEYENTLRDLLGVPWLRVKDLLPEDGRAHGYDKCGTALDVSAVQMAKYLEAADHALAQATALTLDRPESRPVRMYPTDQYDYMIQLTTSDAVFLKDGTYDPRVPLIADKWGHFETWIKDGVYKTPGTVGVTRHLDDSFGGRFGFVAAWPGRYKVRVSVWGYHWDKGEVKPSARTEAVAVVVGGNVVGLYDAPSLKPTVHEVEVWMNPDDTLGLNAVSLWPVRVSERPGRVAGYTGPGVAIDWLEVEGPLNDQWPPDGHRRLFGDLPLTPLDAFPPGAAKPSRELPKRPQHGHNGRNGHGPHRFAAVNPPDPAAQAEKLLRAFLPRAFRRPVTDGEVLRHVGLAVARLVAGAGFEDAMRAAYKAALCSPHFLFLREPAGKPADTLDDFAVAARLSYFLWNSMPDDALTAAAAAGHLRTPPLLREQTDRMLRDPKAGRFVADFLDQWLDLREMDATSPDARLYPEFRMALRESLPAEPRAFFHELLAHNLGVASVVASDFAMVNKPLADLYGLPGVDGWAVRRVALPAGGPRGGFLTQAAVLKVTANGTTTSPVKRGAWVQRKVVGRPPDPPPPDVPAVEPDVRGATTIRELLSKHRDNPGCAACHARIDPPGFALESFDVIGRWRDRYRSLEKGDPADRAAFGFPDHAHVGFRLGLPVDPAGETADGRPFKTVADFRTHLLADRRQLARNLAGQFVTYATGAPVGYADRAEVERVLDRAAGSQFGVRSLLHEVVQSRLFLAK